MGHFIIWNTDVCLLEIVRDGQHHSQQSPDCTKSNPSLVMKFVKNTAFREFTPSYYPMGHSLYSGSGIILMGTASLPRTMCSSTFEGSFLLPL